MQSTPEIYNTNRYKITYGSDHGRVRPILFNIHNIYHGVPNEYNSNINTQSEYHQWLKNPVGYPRDGLISQRTGGRLPSQINNQVIAEQPLENKHTIRTIDSSSNGSSSDDSSSDDNDSLSSENKHTIRSIDSSSNGSSSNENRSIIDLFSYISNIQWCDLDERKITTGFLSKTAKKYINQRMHIMQILSERIEVAINNNSDILMHMDQTEKTDFLLHIILKGEAFYNAVLIDPTFCYYLVNNHQPCFNLLQ